MDPFTQRMLERARARREKLNTQLSNAGHDVNKRHSPLKDANTILAQASVTKSKTPTKLSTKLTDGGLSSSNLAKKSPKNNFGDNDEQENKENGEAGIHNVKSKLQRLGKLYSDDCSQELSSPIHRTEEKFTAEDFTESKVIKKGARLNRFAALASTINNWEDDLSHPSLVKATTTTRAEKAQAKFNEQVKNTIETQPTTIEHTLPVNGQLNIDANQPRQLKSSENSLDNLETQGLTHGQSNSRLLENYKSPQEKNRISCYSSPQKSLATIGTQDLPVSATSCEIIQVEKKKPNENNTYISPVKISSNKFSTTSEKLLRETTTNVDNKGLASKFGSPKNSPHQSPGSVLSKASLFEAKGSEVKVKDPAQMSLSERMALFEKNKGEAPLLPKAPLTMSIPPKKLYETDKPYTNSAFSHAKMDTSNKVGAQRAIFEQGGTVQELENNILRNVHVERQRELDMLRSRFNGNKEVVQVAAGSCIRANNSSERAKSNSPKNSLVCSVKPTPAPDHPVPAAAAAAPPPPPPFPLQMQNSCKNSNITQNKGSPSKRQVAASPPKIQQIKLLSDVKRIRVSPPKSGNLYPNLSDIDVSNSDLEQTADSTEPEIATFNENVETEAESDYYNQNEDDYDSTEESEEINTSFGRSIMRVVKLQSGLNKKRNIEPDSESNASDISVLEEMDEYLDECLAVQEGNVKNMQQEGPTPPKLNKPVKNSEVSSSSFKYTQGSQYRSPIAITSPKATNKENDVYVIEGDNCMPLMHSVSFYRRQQSQTPKTPCRQVSRVANYLESESKSTQDNDEEESIKVEETIKRLLDEVSKQQTIIGQASQALNLCTSTVEFSGSREQVEGERLLLVATHKRQAALNEVQRLKVEGTLRPITPGSPEVQEKGSLTISAISLPFKRDYIRCMDPDTRLHYVCLIRHLDEVLATPVVEASARDSCVRFPSTLKFQNLYSDFKVTIEVYFLQTQAEILPHEIKYHINNNGHQSSSSHNSNKKISHKTPKKLSKHDNRLIMPAVQSPAGPSAVRSPAFALAGYVIFSLKEVHRQQFTLNKVTRQSMLEGRLQMHVSCELSVSVEHHGFLTMFEDVSGFGAWHRRWCLLKGALLSYWKYPDDERKKTPIGTIDLQNINTNNVSLVSRDICARPNTFLLETVRPAQPDDVDSLVVVRNGSETTIRYLLSADTKEDRLEWCSKLNKTLNLIRAWGNTSSS
ncbi:anillin-like isoform X2 [Prorops nasuta]|uniref:anillin-like isoform X2 n=1 Tax=Prorops nasuta TaxID=863751 RepID=UPI0034CD6F76